MLTVYKVVLVVFAVANASYVHPIGYGIEILCTWMYNKYVHNQDASLEFVFVPSLLSAFYKPPTSAEKNGKLKRWKLIEKYDPHGGILNTLIFETLTFIIYGFIGLILRNHGMLNTIEMPTFNENSGQNSSLLNLIFIKFIVDFELPGILAFAMCYFVSYVILMMIYHRFGHPYKMILTKKPTEKTLIAEVL